MAANQRTRTTHADASYWIYQYDALGQVISGKHFWPDGTPVGGQQFEYGFDDIGNRQTAAPVGQASSLPVRAASVPPVPGSGVRGGWRGTRGTDAPQTGRQGCLPHTGGSNLRLETYTANDLNLFTQRTVPGFAEVQGRARSDATVTVSLQSNRGAHPPSGAVFRALAESPVQHAIALRFGRW